MSDFSNRDIDTTVDQFEAALAARKFEIPQIGLNRMLVALDGSNQDRAVLDLSRAIAARFHARLLVTLAPEATLTSGQQEYVSQEAAGMSNAGFHGEPALPNESGRAFDQILNVARDQRVELIAFPSPYLEDFRDLGAASVGTTTDLLLHRRTGPLLIVRKPAENVREQLEDVIVPLGLLSGRPFPGERQLLETETELFLVALLGLCCVLWSGAAGHDPPRRQEARGRPPPALACSGCISRTLPFTIPSSATCWCIARRSVDLTADLRVCHGRPFCR